MSTPTLTEAEVIATGRTVLDRINTDAFLWPMTIPGCRSLRACRDGLAESLEDYESVRTGVIHAGAVFPELEHDECEVYSTALRMLADDVLAWARAAVLVVAEHVGQEAAEALKAAEARP